MEQLEHNAIWICCGDAYDLPCECAWLIDQTTGKCVDHCDCQYCGELRDLLDVIDRMGHTYISAAETLESAPAPVVVVKDEVYKGFDEEDTE